MTLSELMDQFFDETWFAVTTPNGEKHLFWNADYIGGHPVVMSELEPLLDMEIDPDVMIKVQRRVPVVCVELLDMEGEEEDE